jgi:very-short-patch-repair endonuclease
MEGDNGIMSMQTHEDDTGCSINPVVRQRLLNVLEYIEAVEKVGRNIQFKVEDHNRDKFYEEDLDGLPGIRFDADPTKQIWLEIKRLHPVDPPLPQDETLAALVNIPNDPRKMPTLDEETLQGMVTRVEGIDNAVVASVKSAFSTYLSGPYQQWAVAEGPRRKIIQIYATLFGLKLAMEVDSASDPIELIWGLGMGLWQIQGKTIQYPILLQSVEIDIDDTSLSLLIRPRETELLVELTPFAALQNVGITAARQGVGDFLSNLDCSLSPFNPSSFSSPLRTCVTVLDPSGTYWEKVLQELPSAKLPKATNRLVITDTWVLFVRPKTAHFLLQDIERLKETARRIDSMPPGPHALFKDPSTEAPSYTRIPFRGISSPSPEPVNGRPPEDLYFPKPYNREQVQIVERLEQAPGVVAQGPPGTGKTHTIANIICHYLANGKSVLVTSKGEQALRVLKEKLPEAIRPLAVSLLASDRQALQEMEQAVTNILQRTQQIDIDAISREIEGGRRQVDVLCASVARIENEVRDWAQKQLNEVVYKGRPLIPGRLAEYLVREQELHSWLPGPVIWSETGIVVSEDNIVELRALRRTIGPRLSCLDWTLPVLSQIPNMEEFEELHQALMRNHILTESAEADGLPQTRRDYTPEGLTLVKQLLVSLRQAHDIAILCHQDRTKWLANIWHIIKGGRESQDIISPMAAFFKEVLRQDADRNSLLGNPVIIPPGAESDTHFRGAVVRLSQSKPAFGVLDVFTKRKQKKLLQEVRLLDKPPHGSTAWEWVNRHLVHLSNTSLLISRWNAYMRELGGHEIEAGQPDTVKSMAAVAQQALSIINFGAKDSPFIDQHLGTLFSGSDGQTTRLSGPEAISRYIRALENHLEQARLATAQQRCDSLKRILAAHTNPLCTRMYKEVAEHLGNASAERNALLGEWHKLYQELARQHTLKPSFVTLRELTTKIEASGAATWAKALLKEPVNNASDPLLPTSWYDGVEWHRLMNLLDSIDGQHRLQQLAEELRKEEKRLAKTLEKLVENLTWFRMTRISEEHRRALQQYAQAVHHIGAGTGRVRTPRYRRDAREAMIKAVGAVPCWIMPHWRVSESLPAEFGKFDLVIIDEASQSDIWALPALLRGKKILVVGDDKQVSPVVIGPTETQLTHLAHQYLDGFDLGKQMRPEFSIYDLARVAFAADNICLREHFRCVAPIIAFSDRNWYTLPGEKNFLVPLRVPKASERIDPPLVDVFVKDGFRHESNKTNLPEAHAIVREIKSLIDNPKFAGRSIGVISLLGQGAQAKKIAELLFSEIGEEKIREHEIFCGDPPSFQGNEKDIILLSMVDDGKNLRARTDSASAQRFNVAASRAKDRMYLYRSFRREDINNPDDLRGKLLDHFRNPYPQDNRQVATLRELCESDFEERIYDVLVARGYRVSPQVQAGGFRIDLVVEGNNNRRLAVECDGVSFHGQERFFDDLSRQRVLERAGWTFWRCWGANFYRNPDRAMTELYEVLDDMGIEPIGNQSAKPSPLVEYREVYGLFVDKNAAEEEQPETFFSVIELEEEIIDEVTRENVLEGAESTSQPNDGDIRQWPIRAVRQQTLGFDGDNPLFNISAGNAMLPGPISTEAPAANRVSIRANDTVVYCFLDAENDLKTVQIVLGPNQPSMGIINVNAPLAKALIGAEVGDEIDVKLPTGSKTARVLEIEKAG